MTTTEDPNGEPAVPIPRNPHYRTIGAPAPVPPAPTTSSDAAEAGPGIVRRGAVRARFGRI